MPTGYTATIKDDTTLREFAMTCVRAMGVCVTMRDDPHDAPIPERFEPTDYHTKKAEEAKARLLEMRAWGPGEVEAAMMAETAQRREELQRRVAENRQTAERYRRMLALVRAWNPPEDVAGLKEFMADQITGSLDFDVSDEKELARWYGPSTATPAEWLATKVADAERDVAYHTAEHAKEVARVEGRNRWLAAFRASLPKEDAPEQT